MDTAHLTCARQLAEIGLPYRHRPMQSLLGVKVQPDGSVMVLVESHVIHETSTTWIVKARETILRHYTFNGTAWRLVESIVSPDDTFIPYVNRLRGASVTPEENLEKLDWAGLCYRPGTSRFPMSGDQVREDADSAYVSAFRATR